MSAKDCAIILLASGLSKRFGAEDTLLARLAGQAVIDHTLEHIAPVGFGLHIDVIGALANTESALSDKLKAAGYQIIVNPHPENGQGSSLALGAKAVIEAGFEKACIALADMPLVPSEHFTRLIALAGSSDQVVSGADIASRDVTLPPCIFSGQALNLLTQASGDKGAKAYLRGNDVRREKLSHWAAKDIDTFDDLQALELHMKKTQT